jgi:hypothetical protein
VHFVEGLGVQLVVSRPMACSVKNIFCCGATLPSREMCMRLKTMLSPCFLTQAASADRSTAQCGQ